MSIRESGCVDVRGQCECKGNGANEGEKPQWASASVGARTYANSAGGRERVDMGGEKDRWA